MYVVYDKKYNCYVANIKLKVGKHLRNLRAVIDTGATNTTIALESLVKESEVLRVYQKIDHYAQNTSNWTKVL